MMRDSMQLSERDYLQWIRMQLEKREIMNGTKFAKEEMKQELYNIVFYEQKMTVDDIEIFFIPFGQAGYLTARRKFEIMSYVMEKDYGRSYLMVNGEGGNYIITEDDVEETYYQWLSENRLILSEEEKKEFFIQTLMDGFGLGVLEVLNRIAKDGYLIGELCPACSECEQIEERIAVYTDGKIIYLPFLAVESKEEMIRIIKCEIAMENRGELTMITPLLDFVREDGTCVTAIRPPAGRDWGMRILYGATRKEAEWKM